MENSTDFNSVESLREVLAAFRAVSAYPVKWAEHEFQARPGLGEIQTSYSVFSQEFNNYLYFLDAKYHEKKIAGMQKQIEFHNELGVKLKDQNEILEKELNSAKKAFETNQTLYKKQIIAKNDLDKVENQLLQAQHSLVEEQKKLIRNDIALGNYRDTVLELQQEQRKQNADLELAVRDSLDKLQSSIDAWEQRYVLKAPVDGRVAFYKFWSDKQYVTSGAEVMSVVPESEEVVGKLALTERGAGKVQLGQIVRIKLDSYPADRFGTLEGKVLSISELPRESSYVVNVSLTHGLLTSYRKTITFKDGMQGDANIITEDLRILERLFHHFKYLFQTRIA